MQSSLRCIFADELGLVKLGVAYTLPEDAGQTMVSYIPQERPKEFQPESLPWAFHWTTYQSGLILRYKNTFVSFLVWVWQGRRWPVPKSDWASRRRSGNPERVQVRIGRRERESAGLFASLHGP